MLFKIKQKKCMCFILLPAINSTATQFCIIEFNNRSDVDSLEPGQESVCLPIFFP